MHPYVSVERGLVVHQYSIERQGEVYARQGGERESCDVYDRTVLLTVYQVEYQYEYLLTVGGRLVSGGKNGTLAFWYRRLSLVIVRNVNLASKLNFLHCCR